MPEDSEVIILRCKSRSTAARKWQCVIPVGVAPSLTRSSSLPFSLEDLLEIITKEESKIKGLSHYFTGIPCKHGHLSRRNTRTSHCLACLLARANARKNKNPDEYYRKAAELRKRRLDSGKINYHEEHKNNLERRKKSQREWLARNPGYQVAKDQKRRAAKAGSAECFTAQDIIDIRRLQRNKCATCKKSISESYHVDHVVPLSKGGSNGRMNIQLLCPQCNWSKGSMDPLVWNQKNGYLI